MGCSPPGSSVHGILRQEYWRGLPFSSLGDLPDQEIKLTSFTFPAYQAGSLPLLPLEKPLLLLDKNSKVNLDPSASP